MLEPGHVQRRYCVQWVPLSLSKMWLLKLQFFICGKNNRKVLPEVEHVMVHHNVPFTFIAQPSSEYGAAHKGRTTHVVPTSKREPLCMKKFSFKLQDIPRSSRHA